MDDPTLFVQLRDCLVRRVVPTILQAFHTRITVIEAPLIGCYGAGDGWFRRHRDNTSRSNAHRQFAISVNLNEDYDGGEVRFPEFGRELYRPVMGGALVFSCSLLHEALPVTRGRRLGAFTFLSTSGARRIDRTRAPTLSTHRPLSRRRGFQRGRRQRQQKRLHDVLGHLPAHVRADLGGEAIVEAGIDTRVPCA